MPDRIAVIDAFTDAPFGGNPAVVCLLDGERDAAWMQALAREMNQPAAAFVARADEGFGLRWFATTAELALCGHGTLAAAHLLWEVGAVAGDAAVRFRTGAGPLTCRREGAWVAMDFPAEPPRPADAPPGLVEALGVAPRALARNRLDYLVELADAAAVRALRPDLARLATIPTRGVIVTAPADLPGYDCVSRFFAPAVAIDEDQLTGSAHCALGPYWGARRGTAEIVGYQASSRGGTVRVRLRGERVELLGRAATVLRGTLAG